MSPDRIKQPVLSQTEFFALQPDSLKKSFDASGLNWTLLCDVHADFLKEQKNFREIESKVIASLHNIEGVHSVRSRVKDPVSLVVKLIRQKEKYPERDIDVSNYDTILTDLVGFRLLHLFKSDWVNIHEQLEEKFDIRAIEPPTAYIKDGDDRTLYAPECVVKLHDYGYRSVHYLVEIPLTKTRKRIVEIQVRTLIEEAWSEIDHQVRYPNHSDDPVLSEYLKMYSSLAGHADIMGTFLDALKTSFVEQSAMLTSSKQEANFLRNEVDQLRTQLKDIREQLSRRDAPVQPSQSITTALEGMEKSLTAISTLRNPDYFAATKATQINPELLAILKSQSTSTSTIARILGVSMSNAKRFSSMNIEEPKPTIQIGIKKKNNK